MILCGRRWWGSCTYRRDRVAHIRFQIAQYHHTSLDPKNKPVEYLKIRFIWARWRWCTPEWYTCCRSESQSASCRAHAHTHWNQTHKKLRKLRKTVNIQNIIMHAGMCSMYCTQMRRDALSRTHWCTHRHKPNICTHTTHHTFVSLLFIITSILVFWREDPHTHTHTYTLTWLSSILVYSQHAHWIPFRNSTQNTCKTCAHARAASAATARRVRTISFVCARAFVCVCVYRRAGNGHPPPREKCVLAHAHNQPASPQLPGRGAQQQHARARESTLWASNAWAWLYTMHIMQAV